MTNCFNYETGKPEASYTLKVKYKTSANESESYDFFFFGGGGGGGGERKHEETIFEQRDRLNDILDCPVRDKLTHAC